MSAPFLCATCVGRKARLVPTAARGESIRARGRSAPSDAVVLARLRHCVGFPRAPGTGVAFGYRMHSTNQTTRTEVESHFIELLKDFKTATLITLGLGGGLHGRPMAIGRIEDD